MSNTKLVPGYYRLIEAKLRSYDGTKENDVRFMIHNWSFSEGFSMSSIRGEMTIYDTINLMDEFPLRGEEFLTLTFQDSLEHEVTLEFQIFSISELQIHDQGSGVGYKLNFVSVGRAKSEAYRISKAYRGKISEMVQDIFDEYFETDKEIDIEETSGEYKIIIPNLSPDQGIRFLARRAYSETNTSQSFMFFETKERYYFATYEYIAMREKELSPVNPDIPRLKTYTYDPLIDLTGKGMLKMMTAVISINIPNRVNTISYAEKNPYKKITYELDIIQRAIEDNEYNYEDNINSYSREFLEQPRIKNSPDYISDRFEDNKDDMYVIKDYTQEDIASDGIRARTFYPEIMNNKTAFLQHMRDSSVSIMVYGRNDTAPGNLLILNVPEFKYTPGEDRKNNKMMSGAYIITEVKSYFYEDDFKQEIILEKLDWNGDTEE